MKDLCIIHAGMPKTGSTSLQTTLSKGISDTRVSYANLPESNHSGVIYSLFTENPESYHAHIWHNRNSEQIKEYNSLNLERLIKGFCDTSSRIEIISGEDIYHLSELALRGFYNLLITYFKRVIIVAYIRPPKSHMESSFQQLVKYHGISSFDFRQIYHPAGNFRRFDNVFGRDNVYLWKFDPSRFPNGDITLDFCQRLAIDIDATNIVRENESISLEAISVLFAFNVFLGGNVKPCPKEHIIISRVLGELSVFGKTRFLYSDEYMKEVYEKNIDDLEWIEGRLNESIRELNSSNDFGIGSVDELLQFSVKMIPFLREIIGKDFLPRSAVSETPQYVAELVAALKCKHEGLI